MKLKYWEMPVHTMSGASLKTCYQQLNHYLQRWAHPYLMAAAVVEKRAAVGNEMEIEVVVPAAVENQLATNCDLPVAALA